jgi:sulfatase maturation enzyme AslB (radical SAM superfamily)
MNKFTRKMQHLKSFASGHVPGQLVMQYTDHCNAYCPQCGMRVSNKFKRHTLGRERAEKIISAAAEKGFAALSFTGGEPFLYLEDICYLSCFAARQGIEYIRTGTNGFVFMGSEKPDFMERIRKLADQLEETPIRNIWISIDSCDAQMHEEMRGLPGVMRGIEKALPIFAERGIHLSANLGINRNFAGISDGVEMCFEEFAQGFERFYTYVAELGFSIANLCYPMWSDVDESSADAVYAATTSDRITYFSHAEKLSMFRALFETIPHQRHRLRIFTPRASLHALIKQYEGSPELSTPCRGGVDFFFIDSREGEVYPCGYRGTEPMGDLSSLNMRRCGAAHCRRCDWECFRDPSELFAPLTGLCGAPLQLFQRMYRDPLFFKLWWEDLSYYRACHYFNGRIAPDSGTLSGWKGQQPDGVCEAVS